MRRNIAAIRGIASLTLMAGVCTSAIARGQTVVLASFSGKTQGVMCGMTSSKPDTVGFEEVSAGTGRENSGSLYNVELVSLCSAPFFKAYESGEGVAAEFKFIDQPSGTVLLSMSTENGKLQRLSLTVSEDSATLPILRFTLKPMGGGGGPPVLRTMTKPVLGSDKHTIDPEHLPTIRLVQRMVRRPGGSGTSDAAWARSGLAGANVQLGGTINASFSIKEFRLSCDADTKDILGSDWSKPLDTNTAAIKAAATAQNGTTYVPATLTVVNHAGATGLTVSIPNLYLKRDLVSSSAETISVTMDHFTIADVISGASGGCSGPHYH